MSTSGLILNEHAVVTLDGSGNGTAKVGPQSAREIWQPQNAHVSVATNNKEAQCKVYVGDQVLQRYFRDGTLSGSTGDSTDRINADIIKTGQYVFAVWTGGDPGAQAVLAVTGRKDA